MNAPIRSHLEYQSIKISILPNTSVFHVIIDEAHRRKGRVNHNFIHLTIKATMSLRGNIAPSYPNAKIDSLYYRLRRSKDLMGMIDRFKISLPKKILQSHFILASSLLNHLIRNIQQLGH